MKIAELDKGLEFLETNLSHLAAIADGHFIDPKVRPKKDRKAWSTDSYTKDVTKGLEWWRKQPEADRLRYLHSLRDYTLQALQGEFPIERARWVYNILMARPDRAQEEKDRSHKAQVRQIRAEQDGMDPFDIKYRCLTCGKFAHERDETNNKRHEKEEVCTCGGVSGIQRQMAERISEYRRHLKEQKQLKQEKQARVAQR